MQLEADVPVGVFLSGGVDSSAVGALAARARPGRVHTFTVGFDVPGLDESAHAGRVAAALGTRHSTAVLSADTFCAQLDDAFAAVDQPTFDGLNTYFVSRAAREAGMTVALAGTGGDELFGGYPSFARIPALLDAGARLGRGRLGRSALGVAAWGARAAHRLAWDGLGIAPPQSRWGKAADLARASGDPVGLYQVGYALFTRDTQAALAAEAVRAAQAEQDHGLPPAVAADWRRRVRGCEPRQAVSTLELASFAGERLLRDTDAASMSVGLEVRVPLLDHVLAETAARVDPAARFSSGGRKQALRDAALAGLDPALFDRPKSGFVLPIDAWARRRLRAEMDDVFADDAQARRAGLRGDAVRTVWQSFAAGRPGLYWSRPWSLFVLMKWCRVHGAAIDA
jgi:asparagine synthase (glutamine-hydrolysing)